ncbi:tRNA 2-thiouridine(34) synthase MnmA [Solimonas fluminis]|uniref:tRNA-specific 2-thiouridylase MnmA n=1 Tax=Solimonas fluminis TaxID=2086571 RepID=A0A2S5TDT3_9GAMM|nr:tRNA 2-thiouridine(34) synthase MnmA [Solimonas fluminis]PPE73154.1 tRNA 2-thiouridine(34) synthase MnmA [Solimonas fluminis]
MSREHVVVGLSGGVDSSVSAYLLKEQGYRVSGLFMVNWTEDEEGYCSSAQDYQDARAVCEELDIPLHRVDFSSEYRDRVFARFLADYEAGKTPNPDVLCNREVKFQPFREYALRLGADWIATGHYARIEHGADGARLLRSVTEDKDQTYFLAAVAREHLDRVLFPVGGLTKPQVREIAQAAGLPVHRKKDSTGICFIGEREFRAFLSNYLKPNPGPMLDDAGHLAGQHQGLMYYTIGQRRGLQIGGRRGAAEGPWYVVAKDPATNSLRVSQDPQHPGLMSPALLTERFHWIRRPAALPPRLQARIRHRQALQDCRVEEQADGGLKVSFGQPQRAVVPGQFCVLYDGAECLGGGEIRAALPANSPDAA